MSVFCQFCDKEMVFEQSAVTIQDYITCGAGPCKKKAQKAAIALWSDQQTNSAVERAIERAREEDKAMGRGQTPVLVVLFKTKTPDQLETWRVVPVEGHPDSLKDPDVVAHLLSGKIAQDDEHPGWWFHAMRAEDVRGAMEGEISH